MAEDPGYPEQMFADAVAGLEKLRNGYPRPKPFLGKKNTLPAPPQRRGRGSLPTVWPPSEKQKFLAAIQKYGMNNWEAVIEELPTKSVKQCRQFLSRCKSEGLLPKVRQQQRQEKYLANLMAQATEFKNMIAVLWAPK